MSIINNNLFRCFSTSLFCSFLFLWFTIPQKCESQQQPFIKGADMSFLPQIEAYEGIFRDSNMIKDALHIFKAHGGNYIRLRIWHTPFQPDSANNLSKTLSMALRIKQQGLKFLLDFHYSDWWADPSHQTVPSAWSSLPFNTLRDSVYFYTFNVINALKQQHTLPDMVQVGNEIGCGMLWDFGNVCGSFNTTQQWYQLSELLKAGIRGTKDCLGSGDSVRIMIHTEKGTDLFSCQWFFDNLLEENVQFDIIGLSYYPWWHGTLSQLSLNLNGLAQRYDKDIIVVETAYPWTLGWNDSENNIVGDSNQLHPGYPATVEGQQQFLTDVQEIIQSAPFGRGIGVMYWEPDWISAPSFGSAWENLALFDFNGNTLPSIRAFEDKIILSELQNGWNLVSLPVLTYEHQKSKIFPNAVSSAFAYHETGYEPRESLVTGSGYWLKLNHQQNILFAGDSLNDMVIQLNKGWNIIGTISAPVAVSAVQQYPEGILTSGFYSFEQSYHTADTLLPGKGYWIKSGQVGTIRLTK